jgi:hypothetical protein
VGLIGVVNAVLPPLVAALRLPLMLVIGFFAVLIVDDDAIYWLRVIERVAKRQGAAARTDVPGIIFLGIDGGRPGAPPRDARWQHAGTRSVVR